ncbi:MAG: LysR family transcriptional regulator, partial [Anaerolineales bacterium]
MEIHQLEYFVSVVETGSFSRAAERCNVAQPSLSQQIIKLEQEIGHPLFDRLGRKVVLTDFGE